ncbi:MAG: DUF1513 domain-containing protein [Hydrogenophaga sp.]|uniref:DUF1513 domain-containing protein n=1 Tax=Hydrogenophaga sp. TaxID=1904254 RepID=UPI001D55A572|nr:DUF1513 domain-containing protein [Hydrogenophaga sp.]MBX3609879.1 DUF1513 domain-containing protein [Hydrogenophaga sp.]
MTTMVLSRRAWLGLLAAVGTVGAGACLPARASSARTRLLATWAEDGRYHAGVLQPGADAVQVQARIELPTRAHGLCQQADGSVLVAARRPGDWLLHWHPDSGAAQWEWVNDDRRLNGHVMRSPDAKQLWTTETDQADASGLVGVRDPRSLARLGEWRTHGMDPHAMLVLPQSVGDIPAGALIVANGGIPTQSETGRSHRDLDRMDPSLVALSPRDGRLLGQWRLDDARLSIRHLAFDAATRRVGIALQAEHDDEAARSAAPILATWDGQRLQAADPAPGVKGYGGDIGARPGGGFWVGATRGDALVGWNAQGRVVARQALPEACAVAVAGAHWWAGGGATLLSDAGVQRMPVPAALDNHWLVLA